MIYKSRLRNFLLPGGSKERVLFNLRQVTSCQCVSDSYFKIRTIGIFFFHPTSLFFFFLAYVHTIVPGAKKIIPHEAKYIVSIRVRYRKKAPMIKIISITVFGLRY